MKKLSIVALVLSATMPLAAFAQGTDAFDILWQFQSFVNLLVPFVISVGVLYFIWGVVQYTLGKSDDAKKEGRERMIWGIVGLFVIVSIWGLVNLIGNTFDIDQGGQPINGLPCVPQANQNC